MKIKYDKEADVISVIFSNEAIVETDEEKPGMIFDYDANGNVVEMEILNASRKFPNQNKVEYEFA